MGVHSQVPKKTEVVSVNGTTLYYEVYGEGKPLFLLHGYFQSSKIWLPFLSDYSSDFEVYLVDLTGHGKSGEFKETLSIPSVAKDLEALIKHLKVTNIHAVGLSYGGDVLFQLALINLAIINSIITIGACGSWNAKEYPDWLEQYSYKNVENLSWVRELQVDEAHVKAILDQFPNYIVTISDAELKSIKTKTLLMFGDKDQTIPLNCLLSAKEGLINSYLWVLPNTGHVAHEAENKEEFVKKSKEFFGDGWKK